MKLLLIDGNSIMNRGYYALPKELINSKGLHTNAILGFLNIFYKIYDEEKPTHIGIAFDVHEPTFRHKMYAEYKGTRKGMDDELREQFPVIKELLHIMGITTIEKGGYEADDIIGTLSQTADKEGYQVTVLSGDRDLLQLATDRVLIRIPKTKAGKTTVENYHAEDVVTTYGVSPTLFIEMKGLMGDTSDNIPGVPGIGPKTAEKIISEYCTVENAIENIDLIKPDKARKMLDEYRDQAILSRDLARIKLDCELGINIETLKITDLTNDAYKDKLRELELNSILKKLGDSSEDQSHRVNVPDIAESNDITDFINSFSDEKNDHVKDKDYYVSIIPIKVNGFIKGFAASDTVKTLFIRGASDKDLKTFLDKMRDTGVKTVFLSLKNYIDELSLTSDCGIEDLSLAAYLVDPLSGKYDSTYIGSRYLDLEIPSEKDILGKSSVTDFSFDDSKYMDYISRSAYAVSAAAPVIFSTLEQFGETGLYKDIEYPLQFVLRSMENYGILVDREALVKYGQNLSLNLEELEKEITELAGEKFNINSPKQLGVILFEKLGLTSGKKNKNGFSTGAEVLEKIKNEHPIVPKILEYRTISKLKSTYADGLLGCIADDGRIHSTFNQTITATGRISSTEPNLQNIPTRTAMGREIRKVFIPREGYIFIDADYSQIELRVMAAISGDKNLIEAFKENKDIHSITASQVFGVPENEVDSNLRRKAKAVNFGIIYGISSFGLGQDLDISGKEAKEYISKYFETYPEIKSFLDGMIEKAKQEGYVKTLFNRIRPIPELKSSNFMQRSFGERVAMNSPIQGTAADIIKKAMIDVYNELDKKDYKSRLILQIHDELLIEAPLDEAAEVTELLIDKMMNAVSLSVPLIVDAHTGNSLFEAK